MKIIGIFALFTLSTIVEGALWAAAVQPVILTLGAIFTAIDQDVLDVQSIEWKRYLPFINKQDKQEAAQEAQDASKKKKVEQDRDPADYISQKAEQKIEKATGTNNKQTWNNLKPEEWPEWADRDADLLMYPGEEEE